MAYPPLTTMTVKFVTGEIVACAYDMHAGEPVWEEGTCVQEETVAAAYEFQMDEIQDSAGRTP